jgi:hypothetical protein
MDLHAGYESATLFEDDYQDVADSSAWWQPGRRKQYDGAAALKFRLSTGRSLS